MFWYYKTEKEESDTLEQQVDEDVVVSSECGTRQLFVYI